MGRTILHYTILESLGHDPCGEAFLARDTRLRRRVVLEFPALSDAGARERFLREARAAAKLSHPGIAAVLAVEEADGRAFVAVEHVEGDALRELIRRGDVDAARALDVAGQILAALAGAHETSVVHRGLTPDHIVVSAGGRVKVIGFGLPGGRSAARPPGTTTTTMHTSPEQMQGQRGDHRVDLYAFGVILSEMLTGHEDAPGLKRIVEKSTEEDPARRFQSATEILAELARIQADD
jgi:serine/threonine-protein kinase